MAEARSKHPRVVLVEGEAGIGKTALLRHFLADEDGTYVVWSSGDESEVSLDYGIVDQLLAGLPAPVGLHRPSGTGGDASLARGAELLEAVSLAEEHGPVVVVVDDVHWADPSSGRALGFFLRRLRMDSVLVLMAARPGSLARLGEGYERLLRDPARTLRIRLAGLDATDILALAEAGGQTLSAAAGPRLHAHTAGNPLFVSALLRELSPTTLQDGHSPLPAPRSFATTILSRLASGSPDAREVVAAAAVLGNRSATRTVAALAGVSDVFLAVEEAVALGLVDRGVRGGTDEVTFRHPLIRAAVYDDLPPARRRHLHLAAAALLDPAMGLRHRVVAASGFDPELAAHLLDEARRRVAQGALPSAVEHLVWSSRVDPDPATSQRRILEAVELLLVSGDVQGTVELTAAVERSGASTYKQWVLAAITASTGRLIDARAELQAVAEAAAADGDVDLFVRSASSLALVATTLGDERSAGDWATRALDTGHETAVFTSLARQALAWSRAKSGHPREALELLGDAPPEPGAPGPFGAELLATRGLIRIWTGDPHGALRDLRHVVQWARDGYPPTTLSQTYTALAEAELAVGAWDDAVTHVELAESLARDTDHVWHLGYTHAVAVDLYAARGEWVPATEHAAAARRLAAEMPNPQAVAWAAVAAATLAEARGDPASALRELTPLLSAGSGLPVDAPGVSVWRLVAVEALLALGRRAEAAQLLDAADVAPPALPADADERRRLRAAMQYAEGRLDEAHGAFLSLLSDFSTRPYCSARAEVALARLLRESGLLAEATSAARSARETAVRLGAGPLVAAADDELFRCGSPPGTRAGRAAAPFARHDLDAASLAALTTRERVVAQLVAQGLTNREVAAELWVSPKTVEYHLSHIFPKLGVSSRRQLAGALASDASSRQVHP